MAVNAVDVVLIGVILAALAAFVTVGARVALRACLYLARWGTAYLIINACIRALGRFTVYVAVRETVLNSLAGDLSSSQFLNVATGAAHILGGNRWPFPSDEL